MLESDLRKIVSGDKRKRYIFLDCEGRDLGASNGQLGLMQLGIGEIIYLVDVVALPGAVTKLKRFFENPELVKYVWDGRADYSELRHGHDVTLEGLFDLQLADIHTRAYLPNSIRLNGMIKAAEDFQVAEPDVLAQIRSGIS